MDIAIIGSGTSARSLPRHLDELARAEHATATLIDPRLSTFAVSAYERLVVDLGYVDAMQSPVAQGADAILINSFADYGIDAARAMSARPIVGAGEATLLAASQHGTRPFTIVTVWPASMAFLYAERLRTLELGDFCRNVRHVSPEEELRKLGTYDDVMQRMARHDASIIDRLVQECERAVREDGAEAIALGCTCMAPVSPQLATRLNVPVYESSRTGLQAALAAARSSQRSTPRAQRVELIPQIVSTWIDSGRGNNTPHTSGDCPVCISGDDA